MYSSVADMVSRFGAAEMARLSTPTGTPLGDPLPEPITRALVEASARIDSYIRRRYRVPISAVLPEITRAAAILARYDLAHGDDRQPSTQMETQRAEVLDWLKGIRDGSVRLDLDLVATSTESHALAQTREPAFTTDATAAGWVGAA